MVHRDTVELKTSTIETQQIQNVVAKGVSIRDAVVLPPPAVMNHQLPEGQERDRDTTSKIAVCTTLTQTVTKMAVHIRLAVQATSEENVERLRKAVDTRVGGIDGTQATLLSKSSLIKVDDSLDQAARVS